MIHISWWQLWIIPGAGEKAFPQKQRAQQFYCKTPHDGTARHSLDLYLLHLVGKWRRRGLLVECWCFHEHKTQVHGDEHEWKVFMQMLAGREWRQSREAECKTPAPNSFAPLDFLFSSFSAGRWVLFCRAKVSADDSLADKSLSHFLSYGTSETPRC